MAMVDSEYSQVRKDLSQYGIMPEGMALMTVVARWRVELAQACREFFPDGNYEPITNALALRVRLETEGVPEEQIKTVSAEYKRRDRRLKIRMADE
jgi:hypothetical protein